MKKTEAKNAKRIIDRELTKKKYPYPIFVGGLKTMRLIARRGVKALNPRTVKNPSLTEGAWNGGTNESLD